MITKINERLRVQKQQKLINIFLENCLTTAFDENLFLFFFSLERAELKSGIFQA